MDVLFCLFLSHIQVVHLLSQVEAQRLEAVRKEEELTLANQKSRRDQDGLREAQAQLDRLMVQMSQVQQQREGELEKRKTLEEEKERLEERLNQLGTNKESERPESVSNGVGSMSWYLISAAGLTEAVLFVPTARRVAKRALGSNQRLGSPAEEWEHSGSEPHHLPSHGGAPSRPSRRPPSRSVAHRRQDCREAPPCLFKDPQRGQQRLGQVTNTAAPEHCWMFRTLRFNFLYKSDRS